MKYNRSLDYLALSMNELMKGKPQLAARLLAKAAAQPDAEHALEIIEASNDKAVKEALAASKKKAGAKVAAAKRLTAADEDMDEDNPLDEVEDDVEVDDEEMEVDDDEGDEGEEPAVAMAKVLAGMVRRKA